MNKSLKLKCTISGTEIAGMHLVKGSLYDGTPFTILVQEHHTLPNEPVYLSKTVDGFLRVEHVVEQGDRAAIVLPAPSIQFSTNITVNTVWLYPVDVSIKNFTRNVLG